MTTPRLDLSPPADHQSYYPSFLRSARPYPKWHRVVHPTYLAIFVVLAVALPVVHEYLPKQVGSATIFVTLACLVGVYVLYQIWLRLWYQRNYQDLPFLAPPTPQLPTASLAPDPSDPWTHPSFPTFASLRQHEIAAHIPLALRVGLPLYSGPSAGGESAVDVGGPPPPPPPPPPPQYHTAVVLDAGAPPPYGEGVRPKVEEEGR